LAYSPDGRRLAVASRDDRVRLYDARLGHELVQLRCLGQPTSGGYDFIARVVFSPDGNRLAANGWDGWVTIWTAAPGGPVLQNDGPLTPAAEAAAAHIRSAP